MSNDSLNIGGVHFSKGDVKTSSVIYQNGQKINCVWLQNGTKLTFSDQDLNARAYVRTGYDMGNDSKYGTGFLNIKGLSIEGTNKDDYYHVMNCPDYNINVQGGGKDELRVVQRNETPDKGNITADNMDDVDFVDASQNMSMSEGFFIKPNGIKY